MWSDPALTFRSSRSVSKLKFNDEGMPTRTSREQQKTEALVLNRLDELLRFCNSYPETAELKRTQHTNYLDTMLRELPQMYECLDSSRPWCIYWIMQAAEMLEHKFADKLVDDVIAQLIKCRCAAGGFAGGPGQTPHLAPTYAALSSLCLIGTPKAYEAIDRSTLIDFLFSVRQADGSFCLHVGGETDVRGAYCAITCAKLVNLPENIMASLFDKTGDWIAQCQTYEGGFGGAPDLEAHGGYSFCAIAGLALLNEHEKCNRKALLKWGIQRQMRLEGGFQGRTNKLVDGCYTFWVGALIHVAQATLAGGDDPQMQRALFDVGPIQEYILLCCQRPTGGLVDKPGKPPDLYHTCYTLAGMSIAQHAETPKFPQVLGGTDNELAPTHPLFNIPPSAVTAALLYFSSTSNGAKPQQAASSSTKSSTPEDAVITDQ